MTVERRILEDVEFRREADKPPVVRGYAAVFGKRSLPLGGFTEIIERGAFKDVLAEEPNVPLLIDHAGLPIARTVNKTLTLSEDSKGLRIEAELNPGTQATRDIVALLDRGDVSQMSFGFSIASGGETWSEDETTGAYTRTITKVSRLWDVSIVGMPVYPDTSVALRRMEMWQKERAPAEQQPAGTPALSIRQKKLLLLRK